MTAKTKVRKPRTSELTTRAAISIVNRIKDLHKNCYFWDFKGINFARNPDTKIYEPISNRSDHNGENKGHKTSEWFEMVLKISNWVISIVTLAVVGTYTYYAGGQLREMIAATQASQSAASTAACALEENKRQFQDTLTEIQKQTLAQQKAANASLSASRTASDQQQMMAEQYDPFSFVQKVELVRKPNQGEIGIEFQLVNGGGSIAKGTMEYGEGNISAASKDVDIINAIREMQDVHPQPLILEPKTPETFEIDIPGWREARIQNLDLYGWRRFSYYSSFSKKIVSRCIFARGSKHTIRYGFCDPPPASNTH